MTKKKQQIQGDGIQIQDIVSGTIGSVKKLFRAREYGVLPPKARQLLAKHKDDVVTSIKVVRTPIESAIKGVLNIISGGEYEKAVQKASYDSMFHLALYINDKFLLDKQAVVHFEVNKNPVKSKSEVMDVSLQENRITIGELIENTRLTMGDRRFSSYDARKNNCQDFVLAVLQSNGLQRTPIIQFVKQDANYVFDQMPKETEGIAKALTEIGAVADRFIEGSGACEKCKCGGDMIEGNYMIIKNGDCWTLYNTLNKKVLEPCLDEEKKAIEIMKGLIENDKKADVKQVIEKHRKVLYKDSLKKIKGSVKSKMTWIEFYKQQTKGKKFGSRAAVNAHMKECSKKYKEMIAKGK